MLWRLTHFKLMLIRSFEQPGLVEGVPAHGRGVGTRWLIRPLPTQTILWLCNHRMVGVGRDLWGSPSATPCRSRVTQSRLHRTLSRRVLKISREGDSRTSLGSLCQCSVAAYQGKNTLFCCVYVKRMLPFSPVEANDETLYSCSHPSY